MAREGEQPVAISGHSCAYATESIIPRHLAYLATAQDFQISKRKAAKGAKVIEVAPVDLARVEIPAPSIATQQKVVDILDRFDTLTKSLTDGILTEIEARRQQYEYYGDRLLDFPRKAGATRSMLWILDIGSMSA
ncbi:restriction endonuclease subunit S [Bifidobacterium angulatum]|uniref:restriction endonuclease subunit S n=1 Tax=Bifidobacterium angulatum TaxID=1683 RepID=UPI002E774CBE|nr:restriction endonuclease subunit S [Bifidobacterium angulatum]MEE0332337.1 restriction endonuclease subunit S [Bifidobacterium angulatum]